MIAADKGALADFGGDVGIEPKIFGFVPVGRRAACRAALGAPGDKIMVIAAGEGALADFGGDVGIDSKILSLVPVGRRRPAWR